MKIISSKPKRQRIFKSVTIHSKYEDGSKRRTKRPFWIEPVIKSGEPLLWFNTETGEWGKKGNTSVYYAMTYDGLNNAYSLKAVKRLISKWNVPKGTKFRASLPFVGYDFFITK
jgi:hypothetical protein